MDFFLHQDFSELPEAQWNALVEQSIADTPFSRHEYLSEWWKTLGGGEWNVGADGHPPELILVSARENDQLIGIAPLFITEYDGQQTLMLVGSIDQMADDLQGRREAFGISYITVPEYFMEAFAPVVERLSGT